MEGEGSRKGNQKRPPDSVYRGCICDRKKRSRRVQGFLECGLVLDRSSGKHTTCAPSLGAALGDTPLLLRQVLLDHSHALPRELDRPLRMCDHELAESPVLTRRD
jgi:hypothetical protein